MRDVTELHYLLADLFSNVQVNIISILILMIFMSGSLVIPLCVLYFIISDTAVLYSGLMFCAIELSCLVLLLFLTKNNITK